MRKISIILVILVVGFTSCNSDGKGVKSQNDTVSKVDTIAEIDLMVFSEKILKAMKDHDFESFVNFIHPTEGVCFSPSTHIDKNTDKILKKDQILDLSKSKKTIKWGIHEAIGDPISLNLTKYFDQFVYDVDFLKVAKKQINKSTSLGNSSYNISEVYPQCDFVEFYFPGEPKKYAGLDWKALTLIFKKENKNAYLIGVVHGEWAP